MTKLPLKLESSTDLGENNVGWFLADWGGLSSRFRLLLHFYVTSDFLLAAPVVLSQHFSTPPFVQLWRSMFKKPLKGLCWVPLLFNFFVGMTTLCSPDAWPWQSTPMYVERYILFQVEVLLIFFEIITGLWSFAIAKMNIGVWSKEVLGGLSGPGCERHLWSENKCFFKQCFQKSKTSTSTWHLFSEIWCWQWPSMAFLVQKLSRTYTLIRGCNYCASCMAHLLEALGCSSSAHTITPPHVPFDNTALPVAYAPFISSVFV